MHKLKAKQIMAALALPIMVLAMTAVPVSNAVAEDLECSTVTLVSGASTETAGWTAVDPAAAPVSLTPGLYSDGSFSGATATQTVIPPWLDPATNVDFSGATWVSSDATWPGGAENNEGSATSSQWRLFRHTFNLPADIASASGTISFAADNAASVYLNGAGTEIGTTGDVYGATTSTDMNFADTFNASFTPVAGANTLAFVVRNWQSDSTTNPTGLVYKATVHYCVPMPHDNVKVTIVKYVDGAMATANSASSTAFSMNASWDADNIGSGSGSFTLGPTGFNSTSSYTAVTADMSSGADYSVSEANNENVGATCSEGKQFANQGYTIGNTLAAAAAATATTTAPSLTNITSDKYIIVWNDNCATAGGTIGGEVTNPGVLRVDGITVVKATSSANGTFEDGWKYIFHITMPNDEPDLAMKFSDWVSTATSSSATIPVANNMRISSTQADNSGATVMVTAANTYTSPELHMTSDLNAGLAGRQVDVIVEVRIPTTTATGSYTTTYGVRSLP